MEERQPFEEEQEQKKGRFQSSFYDWGEALIISLILSLIHI